MDELHEISDELRRAIEELHNDNPQLRDFWLCVAGSMADRVRKKDSGPSRDHGLAGHTYS